MGGGGITSRRFVIAFEAVSKAKGSAPGSGQLATTNIALIALRARMLGAFVGGLCRPCVCDRWHRGCGAVGGRLGYGGVRLYGSCLEVVWKLSDAGSEVMGCLAVGWRLSGSWLALKRDSWLDWCGGFCRPCVCDRMHSS